MATSAPKRQNPLEALRRNPFVLAPMAGITDHGFRSFMRSLGSSVVITELVSATGIEYKSERTLELMSFDETQRPVGIQLFGETPDFVARAAQLCEEMGADFVDLNFGCPVPKVVKKGAGSAMLRDPKALTEMLSAVVKAVDIPVTIKIRTGWDAESRNAAEVAHIAFNEGITWMAIHGRTRAQGYSGLADWDFIAEVKSLAKLPILGNGDIVTPAQAVRRYKESGVDGIMIGRGALKNPFIFMDAHSELHGRARDESIARDYASLFLKLKEAFAPHCGERILMIQLKKFAAWFATGYPGAAQFRKSVFQCQNVDELMTLAMCFFAPLSTLDQENSSNEGFLMGGHG